MAKKTHQGFIETFSFNNIVHYIFEELSLHIFIYETYYMSLITIIVFLLCYSFQDENSSINMHNWFLKPSIWIWFCTFKEKIQYVILYFQIQCQIIFHKPHLSL